MHAVCGVMVDNWEIVFPRNFQKRIKEDEEDVKKHNFLISLNKAKFSTIGITEDKIMRNKGSNPRRNRNPLALPFSNFHQSP